MSESTTALSVLNAIEEQVKGLERQISAFKHVRQVITTFVTAQQGLDVLVDQEKSLQESIDNLTTRAAETRANLGKELATARAETAIEIASLNEQRDVAKEDLRVITHELEELQTIMRQHVAEAQVTLDAKHAELRSVTTEIEAIRQRARAL